MLFRSVSGLGTKVVLFFMTPNCPSCARMLPGLAQAKDEFSSQGLQVVGLNLLPQAYSPSEVVEYAGSLGAGNLIWVQDENAAVARSFRVEVSGETVAINRQGYVVGRLRSPVPYPILRDLVQQATASQ